MGENILVIGGFQTVNLWWLGVDTSNQIAESTHVDT